MAEHEMIPAGMSVSGAVRGLSIGWGVLDYHWWERQFCYYTSSKYQTLPTERVDCANTLKMGSSHSSFTMKPCACTSMEFLAEITSLAVDDTNSVRYCCNNLIRHLLINFLIKFITDSTLKFSQLLSRGLLHGDPSIPHCTRLKLVKWWMMKLKDSVMGLCWYCHGICL